jgi:DNA-binding MarR family transcriptional regulator
MREPVGRIMSKISKLLQYNLQAELCHLDIDRSFYPLWLIYSQPGMTQQQLANELGCNKVQVVRIIDYLSDHGYVDRMQNADDRRKYELIITDKTELHIDEIKTALEHTSQAGLSSLTAIQIEELYNLLHLIQNNLENIYKNKLNIDE